MSCLVYKHSGVRTDFIKALLTGDMFVIQHFETRLKTSFSIEQFPGISSLHETVLLALFWQALPEEVRICSHAPSLQLEIQFSDIHLAIQ